MSDKTENNKSSLSEAEKFLESLNLPDAQTQETEGTETTTATDPNDIMSFLDEISNYPTEDNAATTATTTTTSTTDETKATQPQQIADKNVPVTNTNEHQKVKSEEQNTAASSDGGWKSWGNSFWNQASAAVKTTTEQINRSVGNDPAKLLESRVKSLQNYVNKENIEKLGTGLKNLTTTLLETVAPPISEHELVEVWLAYDMVGYTGLEALVYRAFARVMEHTESGQVVVRNAYGEEKKPADPTHRDLNMCDSVLNGTKLAKANIDHLVKQHFHPNSSQEKKETFIPQSGAVPIIQCPVFMAIQPVKMVMEPVDEEDKETAQLSFIIIMVDPTHNLKFKTYSQSLPLSWLEIPYEENEWVEDKMVDIIRMSVTSIAQDYVWTRMSGSPHSAHSEEAVQEV